MSESYSLSVAGSCCESLLLSVVLVGSCLACHDPFLFGGFIAQVAPHEIGFLVAYQYLCNRCVKLALITTFGQFKRKNAGNILACIHVCNHTVGCAICFH